MGHDTPRSRMVGRRLNVREIGAAVMFLLSPGLYFIFSETPKAALYQTTAEHGLVLITVPVGLLLGLLARRPPPAPGAQAKAAFGFPPRGRGAGLRRALCGL